MNFLSENILVSNFLDNPGNIIRIVTGKKVNRHFILKEFDSGYGIADIVLGTFTPYLSTRSMRNSIDPNWISTLVDSLSETPYSINDFASKYGVNHQTARDKLNQFVAAEYLKIKHHSYQKFKDYRTVVECSIAIEAKLKNWKQALNQARRYQRFANYAYVLLDKQFSTVAEQNIQIFKQHNIGLITLCGFKPTIHYSPTPLTILKSNYFYRLNEAVYSYFKENYGYFEEPDSK